MHINYKIKRSMAKYIFKKLGDSLIKIANTDEEISGSNRFKHAVNQLHDVKKKDGDEAAVKLALNAAKDRATETLSALTIPIGGGVFGSIPATIVNTGFGINSAMNLVGPNGVRKTIRLANEGDVPSAIKSGLGDALDAIIVGGSATNGIRQINKALIKANINTPWLSRNSMNKIRFNEAKKAGEKAMNRTSNIDPYASAKIITVESPNNYKYIFAKTPSTITPVTNPISIREKLGIPKSYRGSIEQYYDDLGLQVPN